jgi:hypothetical protein
VLIISLPPVFRVLDTLEQLYKLRNARRKQQNMNDRKKKPNPRKAIPVIPATRTMGMVVIRGLMEEGLLLIRVLPISEDDMAPQEAKISDNCIY